MTSTLENDPRDVVIARLSVENEELKRQLRNMQETARVPFDKLKDGMKEFSKLDQFGGVYILIYFSVAKIFLKETKRKYPMVEKPELDFRLLSVL